MPELKVWESQLLAEALPGNMSRLWVYSLAGFYAKWFYHFHQFNKICIEQVFTYKHLLSALSRFIASLHAPLPYLPHSLKYVLM